MPENRTAKGSRPGVTQQRRTILDAAVQQFAATGTGATSVAAICKVAGVSRDTFYRCYSNKNELIDTLYESAVSAPMLASVSAPGADYGDQDWLRGAIDEVVDAILAQHQVAQFLFLESADPSTHAHSVIHSAFEQVAGNMQRWCRKRYSASPSRLCFMGLLSAAQWLVHGAINDGLKPASVGSAKRAIKELFLATFHGAQMFDKTDTL